MTIAEIERVFGFAPKPRARDRVEYRFLRVGPNREPRRILVIFKGQKMGWKGRPKKAGNREASGKLQRPVVERLKEAERKQYEEEMGVVLAQSHRQGNSDQRLESALGRTVLRMTEDEKIRYALLSAGEKYGALVTKYRRAIGAKNGFENSTPGPTPVEITDPAELERQGEREKRWKQRIGQIKIAMAQLDHDTYLMTEKVILEGFDPPPQCDEFIRVILGYLAVEFGFLDETPHPFQSYAQNSLDKS